MLRIGIVGAENSHALAVSKTINVDRKIPGARVVALWGEKPAFARKTADDGDIPRIVKDPADMVGLIDVVMIDHRHGKHHLPAARPFLKARIPMFIDKPFSCSLAEARRFLREARSRRVPVTSFSALRFYQGFLDLKRGLKNHGALNAVALMGPCDIRSKYGGITFYGVHQVEVLLDAFGLDVREVNVSRAGENAVAFLSFRSGLLATLHFIKGGTHKFHALLSGEKIDSHHLLDPGPDPYLAPTRTWTKMARTGKMPYSFEELLAPVAVLEALDRSLKTGRSARVAKTSL